MIAFENFLRVEWTLFPADFNYTGLESQEGLE